MENELVRKQSTSQKSSSSKQTFSLNVSDPDEQFILDIIRVTKQESIQNLIDSLRLQESKSYLLIRMLERYKTQLDNKEIFKSN